MAEFDPELYPVCPDARKATSAITTNTNTIIVLRVYGCDLDVIIIAVITGRTILA